jgi:general secretion pathway protein D
LAVRPLHTPKQKTKVHSAKAAVGKQNTNTFSGISAEDILSNFPGFSYFFNAVDVNVVLNAVARVTDLKVLSSPKVIVLDNKTATLQIGDQIPVIISNAQTVTAADSPVVQTFQYTDTGVILKVTPQVNSSSLHYSRYQNAAPGSQGATPTIQQRKINSAIAGGSACPTPEETARQTVAMLSPRRHEQNSGTPVLTRARLGV